MGDSGGLQQAKLVLLGDMGAGKSSLVLRFVKGQFFDYQVWHMGYAAICKLVSDVLVDVLVMHIYTMISSAGIDHWSSLPHQDHA